MRTVADILQTKGDDIKTIDELSTVYEAIIMMNTHHIGSLVVTRKGKLAGIVSERDYACKVAIVGKQSKNTPISEIMSSHVVVAKRDSSLNECMALMTSKRVRHLPVLENDELVGLVSIGDVVKEIIDEQNVVIEQLESYIHS